MLAHYTFPFSNDKKLVSPVVLRRDGTYWTHRCEDAASADARLFSEAISFKSMFHDKQILVWVN